MKPAGPAAEPTTPQPSPTLLSVWNAFRVEVKYRFEELPEPHDGTATALGDDLVWGFTRYTWYVVNCGDIRKVIQAVEQTIGSLIEHADWCKAVKIIGVEKVISVESVENIPVPLHGTILAPVPVPLHGTILAPATAGGPE